MQIFPRCPKYLSELLCSFEHELNFQPPRKFSTPRGKKFVWKKVPKLGLKRKPLFSFSRKAKISENSLTFHKISFRENFRFRETFRGNVRFRESFHEKFLFPGWFSCKVSVFAKIFNQCFGSRYTCRWLLNPDPHSKRKIFAQNFAKVKVFAKTFVKQKISRKRKFSHFFLSFFCEKRK
jgi:hypothetical protein